MNVNNNNISNSNYGSFENGASNKKEEESIFDKAMDSIKEFFSDDEEENKVATDEKIKPSSYLDRAYLSTASTYTVTPVKQKESLTEKWAKDNESVELKQKDREIAKLNHNINTLQSRNKLLEKQNEMMMQQMQNPQSAQAQTQTQTTEKTQEVMAPVAMAQNEKVQAKKDEPKKYDGLPTHTSIPKEVLEQQQGEIDEIASSTKVEAEQPKQTITEDDTKAMASSAPAPVTEAPKA